MKRNLYITCRYAACLLSVLLLCLASNTQGQIITTFAGNGSYGFSGDGGPATSAQVYYAAGVAVDHSGNVYIADYENYRVRKVNSSGIITTIGGTGTPGYSGDGGPATAAELGDPWGIAVDASDNVYVADFGYSRVRMINTSGIISTVVGTGTAGFSGDGGPATAAKIDEPYSIAVDGSGNLYIGDYGNSRIRKVNSSGIISTIAGNGTPGYSGDGGPATAAELYYNSGVAADGAGNVYICDNYYTSRVRVVNASGIINTFAGNGSYGYGGDGGPATAAELYDPWGIATDGAGNVYITDEGNERVRMVNASGTISTIAGTGSYGYSGDGGPATAAELYEPLGIAVDGAQNIYICDYENWRVRVINGHNRPPKFVHGPVDSMTVCENSTYDSVNTLLAITDSDNYQTEIWSVVTGPSDGTVNMTDTLPSNGDTVKPHGLSYTPTAGYTGRDSFTVRVTDGQASDTMKIYMRMIPSPATITGAGNVCLGFTTALTDVTTGATWSSSATAVATISPGGLVTSVSAGTSVVSYTLSNGCAAWDTVTVNPPAGLITGLYSVCVGSSVTLSDGGGGTWASTNTTIAIAGSSSGVITGKAAGFVAIVYTLPTGCLTTATITVNPVPVAIAGTMSVCAGLSTTLSDGTGGGKWSSSTTSVATAGSGSGVVSGVSGGISEITYSLTTGCYTTAAVTVNNLPLAISGASGVCSGSATALIDAGGGTWSSSATTVSVGSGSGLVTGISAGTAAITYTLPTGCMVTDTITIYGLPSAIAGPTHVCTGSTMTLSDATGGGVWTSQYLYIAGVGSSSGVVSGLSYGLDTISYTTGTGCSASLSITVDSLPLFITGPTAVCAGSATALSDAGGGTWSSNNTSIAKAGSSSGLITGVSAGTATISYTLPTGCVTTQVVNVNPLPTAILGLTHLCVGGFTTLSDATPGGTWAGSGAVTAVIGSGLVIGISAGTGTVTYTVFSTGCTAMTTVTVSTAPAAITGVLSVCAGQTTLLSDIVSGGAWSSSNTGIATAGGTGIVTGVSGGTATITYSPGAGCMATKTVTVHPLTAISGSTTICAGVTTALTDGAAGGTWSSSNTGVATIGGTGIVTGIATGTTTITYLLPTGCTATTMVTVSPSPTGILGASAVCAGLTTTLSDAVTGGNWTSSNTSVAGIGSGSGVVTGGLAGTATISYSLGGSCIVTKTMTVNLSPSAISGTMSVCVSGSTLLSDASSGGTWSSSNTGVATIAGGGLVTGVSGGTATITYNSGCIAVATVTVIATPVAISGTANVCAGLTTILSDGTTGGTWSSGNTAIASIGGGGLVSGVSAGTAIITYSIGTACVATITATVNPLTAITGATTICVSAITTLTDGASGGTWSSPDLTVGIGTATGIVTGVSTGTATITYLLPTGCAATTIVTVSPSPSAISGASAVCTGLTTTLTDAVGGGAWSSGSTGVATVTGGIVTGVTAGTSTISYSLGTGCVVSKVMSVNTSPAAIGGTAIMCIGATSILSDATSGGAWSSGSTGIATVSGGGVVNGISAGTAPIIYTLGSCSATITATVAPTPLAIAGTASVCAGNTTALSDATIGGAWSSGSTGIATISGGLVTGVSAGISVITYATGTGCTAMKTVTVNALSAISGVTAICAGNTTTLSDAATGGTWSSSNTGVATIGGTGIVTGIVPGTSTITYLLPTGCMAIKPVTVNSIPTAITGTAQVCAGNTTTLSDAGGGAWSSSNTAKATIAGTGIVTGVTAGTSTITYSLGLGCTVTTAVTVDPLPSGISGTGSVCAGLTITLSDATTGGAWSSSNTGIATISAGVVTGVVPGTSTISYVLATGCTTTKTINVSSVPPAITGTMAVCPGNTTTLTDITGGGTWSTASTAATVVAGTGVVTGVSAATARITYSIGSGCSATTVVTVDPLPSAISGTPAMCTGATTTLFDGGGGTWSSDNTSVATITGGGFVSGISIGLADITYTLATGCTAVQTVTVNSLPPAIGGTPVVCAGQTTLLSDIGGGVWSSGSKTIAIVDTTGLVTGKTGGTVNITYSMGVGCNVYTPVTVNPAPPAIKGKLQVCTDASTTLSDAVTGGAWSNDNTAVATIDAGSGLVSGLSAGVTTVSYMLSGCPATATLTVNPLPAAISGSAQVCLGSTTVLSDAGAGTWSSPLYTSMVRIGSASGYVTGIATGTASVTYTLPTGCTTSAPVTINPVPSIINGPSSVCSGLTITLSDITPAGIWSSGATATATVDATGTVTGGAAGITDILYAYPATGCAAYKTVTVNPAVPAITGVVNMCAGGATLLLADVDTPYGNWSSTFVTISTGGVVSTYDTGVGTITYTLPTGCFASATLTVNPLPAVITGPVSVCTGQSIALTDSVPGGIWSSADTTITMGGGSGIATGVSAGAAMATYTISDGCSVTHKITVYELPSAIMGTASICVNAVTTLSDALVGGTWGGSSGIATISGAGLVTGMSAGTAVMSYTTGGGCTVNRTVSVMPLPVAYTVTGGGAYCAGGSGFHVYLGSSESATKYQLYDGGTLAGTMTGSGALLDFGIQTAAGDYKVVATNTATSCNSTMADSAIIIVNPVLVPSVAIAKTPADTVCAGTAVALTATPVNGGSLPMYQWKVNGISVGTGGSAYSYTPSNGDVVVVTLTSDATCAIPSVADDFTIMNVETPVAPTVVITADPGMNISKGGSVTFTAVITNGGATPTYEWIENGAVVAGANSATLVVSDLTANETIVCEVTSSGLCSVQGSSNQAYIMVSSTGVNTITSEGELTVTPNPNNGSFIIKGSLGTTNNEEVSLEITDMVGQVVYKDKVTAHGGLIDERIQLNSGIANGMYLLNVRSGAETKVFHIVVEQ